MRKPQPPTQKTSTDDTIGDALEAFGQQRQRREKRKAQRAVRRKLASILPGWVKNVGLVAVLVLAVLLADGIRREAKEFHATLTAFQGRVMVQQDPKEPAIAAAMNADLKDGTVVQTGEGSSATIIFPDGSAVELAPNTEFEVRLLDFARGGRRDRSFMVRAGMAFARVSEFFGARSEATVCTPTAVAAVRGTAFTVAYDPRSGRSQVQVAEGAVDYRTPAGASTAVPGQMVGSSAYYRIDTSERMSDQQQSSLRPLVMQAEMYEKPPGFLHRVEWGLTHLFDPLLQLMGIAPGGWAYSSIDIARRTVCLESLRQLRTHIEAMNTPPEYLNPVTLAELGDLDPDERDKILEAFAGGMIDSYTVDDAGRYEVRARARDKKRTPFRMTNATVERVTDE